MGIFLDRVDSWLIRNKIQKDLDKLQGLTKKFCVGQAARVDLMVWEESLSRIKYYLDKAHRLVIHTSSVSLMKTFHYIEGVYSEYRRIYLDYLVVYYPGHVELKTLTSIEEHRQEVFKKFAYRLLYEALDSLDHSKLDGSQDLEHQISSIIDIKQSNKYRIVTRVETECVSNNEIVILLLKLIRYVPDKGYEDWHKALAFCLQLI